MPVALALFLGGMQYVSQVRVRIALEDAGAAAARVLLTQHNLCFAWLAAVVQLAPAASGKKTVPFAENLLTGKLTTLNVVLSGSWRAASGTSIVWEQAGENRSLTLSNLPADLQNQKCILPSSSKPSLLFLRYQSSSGIFFLHARPTTLTTRFALP